MPPLSTEVFELTLEQSFSFQQITREIDSATDLDKLKELLKDSIRLCMIKENAIKFLHKNGGC